MNAPITGEERECSLEPLRRARHSNAMAGGLRS